MPLQTPGLQSLVSPLRAAVHGTLGGRSSLPPVAELYPVGVAGASGNMGVEGGKGEGAVDTEIVACGPQGGEVGGEDRDSRLVLPEMLPTRFPGREGGMAGGARVLLCLDEHIIVGGGGGRP